MSIVNENGEKVELPREPGMVYKEIQRAWKTEPEKLRQLAMLQLHEFQGWPTEMLGIIFRLNQGNVSRGIRSVRKALYQMDGLRTIAAGEECRAT